MKKKITIPKFKNEDDERKFWSKIDLSQYLEPKDSTHVFFPHLKPTSRSISIRIPEYLLARLQEKAHELNIPYQSLMKQYVAEGVLGRK